MRTGRSATLSTRARARARDLHRIPPFKICIVNFRQNIWRVQKCATCIWQASNSILYPGRDNGPVRHGAPRRAARISLVGLAARTRRGPSAERRREFRPLFVNIFLRLNFNPTRRIGLSEISLLCSVATELDLNRFTLRCQIRLLPRAQLELIFSVS